MPESKKEEVKKDLVKLKDYYKRNHTKVIKNLLWAILFFFLAMFFAGVKFLYPAHFFITIVFLLLAIKHVIGMFLLDRKKIKKIKKLKSFHILRQLIKQHKISFIIIFVALFITSLFLTVMPIDQNPYQGMNQQELESFIDYDLHKSIIVMDNMEIVGEQLLQSNLFNKKDLSPDQRKELREKWNNFVIVMIESEKLTERHKYFNQISYLSSSSQHAKSFVIAYSLFVKKYELIQKLIQRVDNSELVKKILNENSEAFGGRNSYYDVVERFYESKTFLKKNLGRAYLIFIDTTKKQNDLGEDYIILKNKAEQSYDYLIKNIDVATANLAQAKSDKLEKDLFNVWFPIQKNSASFMGDTNLVDREKLITEEQISEMKKKLEPGDIIVERKNWYLSNIGIPGFWPHAALYIGEVQETEKYFADIFPFEGYENYSALIKDKFPKFYNDYSKKDDKGLSVSVIEAMSEGVILQTLEKSAHADYVGAMRPLLSKEDKLKAILRSFENYSKPYDYNFDFDTRDEIVCSELVYDAYLPTQNKKGLKFDLGMLSGRKVISPTDFVKKYFNEKGKPNQELDFVYFIDGNEKLGKAFVESEADFLTSWTRPKYDWFQQ